MHRSRRAGPGAEGGRRPRLAAAVLLSAAVLPLLHACATRRAAMEAPSPPRHLLAVVVHGDGAYLYHDREGRALRGDRTALERARQVARSLESGEVFIFHQKPVRRLLSVPVGRESELLWYRGGALVSTVRYTRAGEPGSLSPEMDLLREARPGGAGGGDVELAAFMYFGHQLPEVETGGYHLSCPRAAFTAGDVAEGAASFARWAGRGRLDLVVLSTCFGGTPGTVAFLAPHTRYLVASPASLHLSHLDIGRLGSLSDLTGHGLEATVLETARRAFRTLAESTTTEVAVAVYETGVIGEALDGLLPAYRRLLRRAGAVRGAPPAVYRDCAGEPGLEWLRSAAGVTVFYRAPLFGRNAGRESHSGWGCPQAGG